MLIEILPEQCVTDQSFFKRPRRISRYVVLCTPVLHSVYYLFCLEWAFFYSHDSCARMVLGLLASPFHGKLNLTSMN